MSVTFSKARVIPTAGGGVVRRSGSAVLFVAAGPEHESAAMLFDAVGDGGDDGRVVSRRLAVLVVTAVDVEHPPFCLIAQSEERLVVMVHGPVVVYQDGAAVFRGDDSPTWVDGYLDEEGELAVAPAGTQRPSALGLIRLDAGTVPAGGFVLSFVDEVGQSRAQPAGPGDEPPTGETPYGAAAADESIEDASFELFDLSEPPAGPPAEPLTSTAASLEPQGGVEVEGVRCSRGHFNHPLAPYCAACGIKMVHQTKKLVFGVRPPVGLLVFDDGTTYALDSGYVIGREPEIDELVRTGAARPLRSAAGTLSRVHAEVTLDGWDVLLVDRGSTNGTFVRIADGGWERLATGEPHRLSPGAEMSLGDRRFVFESNVIPRD